MNPSGPRIILSLASILYGFALAQPMPSNVSLVAIRADEQQRDHREKLPEIIRALQLKPSSMVGDLGTGYGYYAARFSPAVGPAGRVFAEEIDASLLAKVRERVEADHLENVTLVLGTPTDPKFPKASLDAVIIADVYHEIERPEVVISRVKEALKPGGLLMIVDYLKPELRNNTRKQQGKEHNIAPAFVEHDLEAAGFTPVERRDPYCPGYDEVPTYFHRRATIARISNHRRRRAGQSDARIPRFARAGGREGCWERARAFPSNAHSAPCGQRRR